MLTYLIRHCEERSDAAIHVRFANRSGLLRYARNDEGVNVIPDLIRDPAFFARSAQSSLTQDQVRGDGGDLAAGVAM